MTLKIVNKIVAHEELNNLVNTQARKLCQLPLESLCATKALLREPMREAVLRQMTIENNTFGKLLDGDSAKIAMRKFFKK